MSDQSVARDLTTIAELTAAICLAPCLEEPRDPAARDEAEELHRVVREVKHHFDRFLTDDVRADIAQLIQHLDDNRERYRQSVLRWIDLLEEIAYMAEQRYGSGTGPTKQRKVRAAIYYILKGFFADRGLPTIPAWLRPIALEIVVRATVEYIVSLDNPRSNRPRLWRHEPGTYNPRVLSKERRAAWARRRSAWAERLAAFFVRIFFREPRLEGPLRERVDAILDRWAARNRIAGNMPFDRFAMPVVQTLLWIGRHADQVRSALEIIALAIYETRRLTSLDRAARLEVVKETIILMFEDLGYRGAHSRVVIRFLVDIFADATDQLFAKRRVPLAE